MRFTFDETLVLQPDEHATDDRPADPEAAHEIRLDQSGARMQVTAHDRVTETFVRTVLNVHGV